MAGKAAGTTRAWVKRMALAVTLPSVAALAASMVSAVGSGAGPEAAESVWGRRL